MSPSPVSTSRLDPHVIVLATTSTLAVFYNSTFPSVFSLLLTFITVLFAPPLPSMQKKRRHALRLCEDPIGLVCGSLLPLSLLRSVSSKLECILIAVCIHVNVAAWRLKRAAIYSTGLYCLLMMSNVTMFPSTLYDDQLGVLVAVVTPILTSRLITNFPRTFTVAESAITSGAIIGILLSALNLWLHRSAYTYTLVGSDGINALSTAALLGSVLLILPLAASRTQTSMSPFQLLSFLTPPVSVVYLYATSILQREPVTFVFEYLLRNTARWGLLLYWIGLLSVTIAFIKPEQRGERIVARKWYHILALLIFSVGQKVDASLTRLGAAVALCGMIFGEMCRESGSGSLQEVMQKYAGKLVDERDEGAIVVTHIYLLMACAGPMWIGGSDAFESGGVSMVCVLDSVAAIVGRKWGSWKWGRRRSVQGSLAGWLAACVWMGGGGGWRSVVACGVAAILEAWTDQIDNLVLPMGYCAVVGSLVGL